MSRRTLIVATAVIAIEAYLYTQYAALDAQFHFWLHGLFGAALGLVALAAFRMTIGTRATPWGPGFLGHVYSALPDVLFLTFGVLHALWMDVFAFHISLHFIPWPLPTMLVVFTLALAAERAAAHRRPAVALGAVAAGATLLVIGLALRSPLPETLHDLRARPGIALLCPLTGADRA